MRQIVINPISQGKDPWSVAVRWHCAPEGGGDRQNSSPVFLAVLSLTCDAVVRQSRQIGLNGHLLLFLVDLGTFCIYS